MVLFSRLTMRLTSIFLIRLPFVCSAHIFHYHYRWVGQFASRIKNTEGRQPKRNPILNTSPDLGIPSRTNALWPSFRPFCHTGVRTEARAPVFRCLVYGNLDLIPIGNRIGMIWDPSTSGSRVAHSHTRLPNNGSSKIATSLLPFSNYVLEGARHVLPTSPTRLYVCGSRIGVLRSRAVVEFL
jgi:hypothetical protein